MPEVSREAIERTDPDPDPIDFRATVICTGRGGPRRRLVDLDSADDAEEWIDCDRATLVDVGGAR